MEWKTVGEAVKKYAPTLGTLVAGPAGGAAGGAVALLLGALGLEGDATPDAAMAAIQADPAMALKLRELEMKHQETLTGLVLQAEQAHLADRQSARDREIEITKATGKRDLNLYILAWVVVGGFFILTGLMMILTIPEPNVGPANILFGALVAGFTGVLAYFFGSSQSSDMKTKMLNNQK